MSDEAHAALVARRGMGEAIERVGGEDRGKGKGRETFSEDLGLVRPGGGPNEEAMPGAKAQQAGGECECVYEIEDCKEE